jgi:O-antigen/teichoic acid export membrane protein
MGIRRLIAWGRLMVPFLRRLVAGLMASGGTISQQLARGGVWVFVSYGLEQALSLVRSIILARLLAPADFGLMGMALFSLAFLAVFTQTGIWPALIQRPELDQPTLNTAWLISVSRGLILGILTLAAAPWVARFFGAPLLSPILRVMALSFVLAGLNSLGLVLLQKGLDFRKLAVVNVVTSFVNLVAATVTAFLSRSVWALVIGTLAGSVAVLLLSYRVHPFRPHLPFDRERARELLGFGKHITASSVVTYALNQGDDAYVGKVLGSEALGYYGLAYRLSNLPATSIAHVIGRVTLPAYSAMQHDLDQLRGTYLRILKLTALVSLPVAVGLFSLAPLIVRVLYGDKWLPVVPAFQILCLFGLERSIGATSGPIFLALGRPEFILRVLLVKLVVMAIGIVPLTARYGIVGTSIAVSVSAIAVQMAVVPAVSRLLHLSLSQAIAPLLKPLAGSLLLLGILLLVKDLLSGLPDLCALLFLTLLAILVYGGFVVIADRRLFQQLRTLLVHIQS